jgi:hypothetical protein
MRPLARWALTIMVAATFLTAPISSAEAPSRDVGPGTDWCAAANALSPGEELRLKPGDYTGPCTIRTGGARGAPIVIRGTDPDARPRLVFAGSTDNVVNVAASHVTLRGLAFGPTRPDVDGVRIKGGDDITVEDCVFVGLGGIAIVDNTNGHRIAIRSNEIAGSRATAIYLGCHDGASCRVADAVVEGNSIRGVDAPAGQIGYGIQVKLNSTSVIRGNAIADTKGPGIMVYGARDIASTSAVERNVVVNSRTEAGIVIGGGPAIVSNNIVVGGPAGIALEDYGTRGLLRGIVVAHNTVYGGVRGGIMLSATGQLDARLLYNAAHSLAGAALPDARPGLLALGNVNCRVVPCFVDPLAMNFTPVWGSVLIGRAAPGAGVPTSDLRGVTRPPAATVGAVEAGGDGQIIPGRRRVRDR